MLTFFTKDLVDQLHICPKCGHHFRIDAETRTRLLLDDGWEELFTAISPSDPLAFRDTKAYKDRLRLYQRKLGIQDAMHVLAGSIEGLPVILGIMNYNFMGGSMGSVVGERFVRGVRVAYENGDGTELQRFGIELTPAPEPRFLRF